MQSAGAGEQSPVSEGTDEALSQLKGLKDAEQHGKRLSLRTEFKAEIS